MPAKFHRPIASGSTDLAELPEIRTPPQVPHSAPIEEGVFPLLYTPLFMLKFFSIFKKVTYCFNKTPFVFEESFLKNWDKI